MTRRKTGAEVDMAGTRRRDRPRLDEQPPNPEPLMPAFLSDAAQRLWRKHASTLASTGRLSTFDVEAFGVWCCMQTIAEQMFAEGKTPPAAVLQAVSTGANAFGLTPAARLRISGKLEEPAKAGKSTDFGDLDD
jgi:phage terminase small subunit